MPEGNSGNETQDYQSDPDVVLMLEFQKGDNASFETLMHKYYARILNFINRFVNNREVAEDLTQEVFIRVYKTADRYQPQSKFRTWVYTIAKNLSLNELRKNKRLFISLNQSVQTQDGEIPLQVAASNTDNADKAIEREETARLVQKAVGKLPENQRCAVLLRRYENFSYEEIAGTMNCSVSAVKSLLSRAKENLRASLSSLMKME